MVSSGNICSSSEQKRRHVLLPRSKVCSEARSLVATSLVVLLLLHLQQVSPSSATATVDTPPTTTFTVRPSLDRGRRFDGVGGVSGGGGGTRLLLDYPEPQRSDILDVLFKPYHGASLHVLKVEIGCDGDTTQGSEQTHLRGPDDNAPTRFSRGYENWLMIEARKRAPAIHLSGLFWGAPGWVMSDSDSVWTPAFTEYVATWVSGLRHERGLVIDSIGLGFNERGYSVPWIINTTARLRKDNNNSSSNSNDNNITTIAADLCCGSSWNIAEDMVKNATLRAAVDVIGVHCPGPANGNRDTPEAAVELNIPLWDTEQHLGLPDPNPVPCWEWAAAQGLAQVINQNILQNITATLIWTPIYSWYAWLPYAGKGLLVANTPWNGAYNVSATTWAVAHTTQFTQPGWYFVNGGGGGGGGGGDGDGRGACGHVLKQSVVDGSSTGSTAGNLVGKTKKGQPTDASWTSYVSPDGRDLSIVLETMTGPERNFDIGLTGAFATRTPLFYVWRTNETQQFVASGTVPVVNGRVRITVGADSLVTLSTTNRANKGTEATVNTTTFTGDSAAAAAAAAANAADTAANAADTAADMAMDNMETDRNHRGRDHSDAISEAAVATEEVRKEEVAFPMPYNESFDTYSEDALARYFSDMNGAFSVSLNSKLTGGGGGGVLMQRSTRAPMATHTRDGDNFAVAIGDATWTGYTIRVRAMAMAISPMYNGSSSMHSDSAKATLSSLKTSMSTTTTTTTTTKTIGSDPPPQLLFGSHVGSSAPPEATHRDPAIAGFVLALYMNGTWSLTYGTKRDGVAKGTGGDWGPDVWANVEMTVVPGEEANTGNKVVAIVNGKVLANTTSAKISSGNKSGSSGGGGGDSSGKQQVVKICGAAFLGTGIHPAAFDDFSVTPATTTTAALS